MYRYYVPKRAPLSFWMLDDTYPFLDDTGMDAPATKKAGTADPTKSVPLVAGAQYSSVFDAASVGQFTQNVFKQGLEQRPFALESWVLPVPKSDGVVARTQLTNFVLNPSGDASTANWQYGNVTGSLDAANKVGSGSSIKCVVTGTSSTPYILSDQFPIDVSTGVASASIYVMQNAAVAGNYMRFQIRYYDAGGAQTGSSALVNSPTTYNKWAHVKIENSAIPANTVKAYIIVYWASMPAVNDTFWIDGAIVTNTPTAQPFFDGQQPGYEWTGTPHQSASRTVARVGRVNLATNPGGEFAGGFLPNNGTAYPTSRDTTVFRSGTASYKSTVGTVQGTIMSAYAIGMHASQKINCVPGEVYTLSYWTKVSVAGTAANVHLICYDIMNVSTATQAATAVPLTAQVWTRVSATFTIPANTYYFYPMASVSKISGNAAIGDYAHIDDVLLEKSPVLGDNIDGSMASGTVWYGTANQSATLQYVSSSDQQVLSNNGQYDGLSINGRVVRFGTSYLTSGNAYCDYDLGEYQLAHVVGIHNMDENQLWVNGEMVSSVAITDAQKADSYIVTDGNLYSGFTLASSEVAMNGVAVYASLSGDQIKQNYAAGIDTLGQNRVTPQLGGTTFSLDATTGSVFISESWAVKSEFEEGLKTNVELAPDQIEPSYVGGVSVPGDWKVGIPLDAQGDTSIYGVMVAWSGYRVTVDVSLDGTTWTAAKNGELVSIIPNAYDPTGKDLQIRVSFAGGLAADPAYLESLRVIGFRDNAVNSLANRAVSVSYPAVVRGDYEPTLYRDDNGVNLHGGTLTIGTDSSADPDMARTLELWIKPLSGTPTISVTGTKYRNGFADSTMPVGEWSLIHIVAAADIASAITITGDCIVGQATTYPTALSATDVEFVFDSYIGAAVIRFTETATVGVSESAGPISVYAHDWAIDGAG